MAVGGCGKKASSSEQDEKARNTTERILTETYDYTNPLGEGKSMPVDIIIHNHTTNDYMVRFDEWGPEMRWTSVQSGATKTNESVNWEFHGGSTIMLTDDNAQGYLVKVSFVEVNKEIASGKYHRIDINILGSEKAELSCE